VDEAVAKIDAVSMDGVRAYAADMAASRAALAVYGPVKAAPGIEEIRRGLMA
jgi:hypothetical protein